MIFGRSSYRETKIKKKKKISRTRVHGTQVACEVLEFMELEFLEKIQVELEFHELKYFIKFPKKKKTSKSTFSIARCSKNRVLYLKLDFFKKNLSFQTGVFR